MNYSEIYFELDSEEATHSHPLSPIVTLSVVCTLMGTCQHTLFDLGVLRYINTRDQSNVKGVEDILQILSYFKALNAMYVEDIGDGVCSFYANVYRHSVLHTCPSPCQEERLIVAVHPVGLAVHHHAVRGGSFVNFLGLVKLQG